MPASFIFGHTMLKVEDGIALLGILVVLGRRIDVAVAGTVLHLAPVLAQAHLTVGIVLVEGVVGTLLGRLGHLKETGIEAAAIDSL